VTAAVAAAERETRYKIVKVELKGPSPLMVEFDFAADHFAVIDSTALLDNVYVAFNEPGVYIPLSKATLVRTSVPAIRRVWIDWEPSEAGRWILIYYSGAPFIEIAVNVVTVGGDLVGLAKEGTLEAIKSQTDKLTFTSTGELRVTAVSAQVPNIDVPLSTRASESTLSGFSGKFPSAAALADNLSNPTTTIVGSALLAWDGTYWRRVAADSSSRLRVVAESVANPPNLDVALSAVKSLMTPILKGSVFNASVSADTNIFASDLAPTYSPTAFRIYACFDAAGVLSVVRTKADTTVTEQLNAGYPLNANAAYTFDVIVESGESINLQYSVAATALVLKVVEVPLMTA
jgi:hypothetical protein